MTTASDLFRDWYADATDEFHFDRDSLSAGGEVAGISLAPGESSSAELAPANAAWRAARTAGSGVTLLEAVTQPLP